MQVCCFAKTNKEIVVEGGEVFWQSFQLWSFLGLDVHSNQCKIQKLKPFNNNNLRKAC